MFEFLESFQKTPHGSVVLGAIGSIVAVIIIKVVSLIIKKWIPSYFANVQALQTLHQRTIKTGQRNDTLFLLVLYSAVAIGCLVFMAVCLIRITIYEMVINYQGYKLIINYLLLFVTFYVFYRAASRISDLSEALYSKHGIDYEKQESTNKANSADAKSRAAD
jgi:hypothetical protein